MKRLYYVLLVCFGLATQAASFLHAQEEIRPIHGRAIESFPYPFSRMTYIQPRFDQTNNDDGSYFSTYTLRAFTTYWSNWHFRVEIPLANSNSSGENIFGLSDVNIRGVHTQRLHDKLFIGYGAQLVMNTATNNSIGGGKWDIRPGLGLIYFRGTPGHVTGTGTLSLEYRTTIAKEAGTTRTNVLALSPNIDWWFKRWYIGYYATWSYDFKNEVFDLPIDVEAGYSITPTLTLSGEFVFPLISDVSYRNEFAVKVRYSF